MPIPTPTLVSKTAPAGHIKLKVTNLLPTDGIVLAEFQIARDASFTTGLETIENRRDPCEAVFAIEPTYRRDTHYGRVRLTQWEPPAVDVDDLAGTETVGAWSSTVTITNGAAQVDADDILTIRAIQVEKSPMFGVFDVGWTDLDPNLETFLGKWEEGEVGGPYEGKIRSKALTGMPFRTVITSPETIDITNSMVLANTGLNFYADTYTYRIRLSAVIQFSAVTDLKFRLNGPTWESGHMMKRVGDGADVTDTEVTLGTPTVAVENWPATTTITKTGTGTHFAVIQYEGIVTSATDGTIALQAADATSQGTTFAPSALLRIGSFIEWEEI